MSLLFNGMGVEPGNDRLKVMYIGLDQIPLPGATTFAITILSITAFSIKDLLATFSMKGLLATLSKNDTLHNTPY